MVKKGKYVEKCVCLEGGRMWEVDGEVMGMKKERIEKVKRRR